MSLKWEMQTRPISAIILSLPFLFLAVLFDIVKFPVVITLYLPIWGLMWWIMKLRREEGLPKFFRLMLFLSTLGIGTWMLILNILPEVEDWFME